MKRLEQRPDWVRRMMGMVAVTNAGVADSDGDHARAVWLQCADPEMWGSPPRDLPVGVAPPVDDAFRHIARTVPSEHTEATRKLIARTRARLDALAAEDEQRLRRVGVKLAPARDPSRDAHGWTTTDGVRHRRRSAYFVLGSADAEAMDASISRRRRRQRRGARAGLVPTADLRARLHDARGERALLVEHAGLWWDRMPHPKGSRPSPDRLKRLLRSTGYIKTIHPREHEAWEMALEHGPG